MDSRVLTLNAAQIAALVFQNNEKTFRNRKAELYRLGFPAPLDLPGQMLWLRMDVEAWLESRRQVVQEPRRPTPKHIQLRKGQEGPQGASEAPAQPDPLPTPSEPRRGAPTARSGSLRGRQGSPR
jgi:hypothetical protein